MNGGDKTKSRRTKSLKARVEIDGIKQHQREKEQGRCLVELVIEVHCGRHLQRVQSGEDQETFL